MGTASSGLTDSNGQNGQPLETTYDTDNQRSTADNETKADYLVATIVNSELSRNKLGITMDF